MRKLTTMIRRCVYYTTALVLVAGYPLMGMAGAQEATIPPEETSQETVVTPQEPELTYTFNPETQKWESEKWRYNPATGAYETPPAPTVVAPPVDTTDDKTDIDDSSKSSTDLTSDSTVTLDNDVDSDATSGDSAVTNNTTAGNALTGNANVSATLLNSVNSALSTDANQKVATFTQDIMGDVKGDIMLYPMLLKELLEAEVTESLEANVKNDFQINNDIDLTATTGNALVKNNTSAGDATTGNAHAVANVVNILNSMIATQQSFVGTINIYGNLEGDILVAPDFIPQMLAHNGTSSDSSTKLNTQDSQTIINNVNAVAESGAAAILNNTSAGNATTGSADTNIVIFNLTGHEIIAKNSLLVFVNVLGRWVGVIIDAPTGATAAMLGNGVSSHMVPDVSVTSEVNHGIVNNVNVTARTGDAEVSSNTLAGNATSGHAKAAANIANISGSQFGISDWFGVLFINVFQNWYGSFGVNTAYGDPTIASGGNGAAAPTGVIEFIPQGSKTGEPLSRVSLVDSRAYTEVAATQQVASSAATLGAVTSTPENNVAERQHQLLDDLPVYDYRLWIVAGSMVIVGLSVIGLKRLFN